MRKTTEELRTWLEQRLGTPGGFDVLWQRLEQDHDLGEYRQDLIDKEEVLCLARKKVAEAHELSQAFGDKASGPQRRRKDEKEDEPDERYLKVDLSAYEIERARAYEEVLAREAALNQGPDGSFPITNWRRRFFGERLLSLEEAHGLLESPAARFLHPGLFEEWGIPLVGHAAEVLEYDSGTAKPHIDHRATIEVDPPGVVKTVYYADQKRAGFDPEGPDWHWFFHWDKEGNDGVSPEERLLRYKDRDGLKDEMWVWPGSVLDSLRSTGARWARALGWEQEDMTMWLLTGEPFEWNPLKARVSCKIGRPLTVSLAVHPWISANTVVRNYRKIQRQLFGRDNRPLRPKSLAVLRFVEKRAREVGGKRPSWSRLMDEWNSQYRAGWHYTDRRNLSRDYRKALDAVAHSSYYLPKRRVSSAAKRKAERKNAEAHEAASRTLKRFRAATVQQPE